MKILCVHQGHELYGSDRSFLHTVKTLKDNYPSSHITVILPKHGALKMEIQKVTDHIIIEDIGSVARNDLKAPIRTLFRILKNIKVAIKRSRQYDLIYINTIVVLSYIIAQVFIRRISVIHVREIPKRWLSLFFSIIMGLSRSYKIFNSFNTKAAFFFQQNARSHVILNAVAPIQSVPMTDDGRLKILILGRISEWKGQLFFLQSIDSLSPHYQSKIKIKIVGGAPPGREYLVSELQGIIQQKFAGLVELFDFSDKPERHIQWANLIVVPSTNPEPFGRVAIEAFSAGRPVLAAKHGGLKEIITEGETGWFFTPASRSSLNNKLKEIIDLDFKILESMGKRAMDDYASRFTLKRYDFEFLNFISKLLKKINNKNKFRKSQ